MKTLASVSIFPNPAQQWLATRAEVAFLEGDYSTHLGLVAAELTCVEALAQFIGWLVADAAAGGWLLISAQVEPAGSMVVFDAEKKPTDAMESRYQLILTRRPIGDHTRTAVQSLAQDQLPTAAAAALLTIVAEIEIRIAAVA